MPSQEISKPPHSSNAAVPNPMDVSKNALKMATQSVRLLTAVLNTATKPRTRAPDPFNLSNTLTTLVTKAARNPAYVAQAQLTLWRDHLNLWQHATRRLTGEQLPDLVSPEKGDRRFRHAGWSDNQFFDFIKQSHLINARWLEATVTELDGLDENTRQKAGFFAKQVADALSPSNFLFLNPEVIETTLAENGENLVRGLEHLLEDLERGDGEIAVQQTDMDAFEVGRNMAVTPGKIVYQNDLMQLIQYSPTTEQVYETPLFIIPPWINKFYILDLNEEKSFVKWLIDKGYTLFVVSWINPTPELAKKSFEDYMHEGIFDALSAIETETGQAGVNAVGYCIGGTLLASTLAYMATNDDNRIKAATFFAAQADFTEAGDLKVFIDEEQISKLELDMERTGGVLEGSRMATTFNMLRSNDLIWSNVVNNYLLGRTPPAFDLLFWNADATRMPSAMHLFYLRECYLQNNLAEGNMILGNQAVDLSKIKIPIYLQSSKEDHIAPARSVYKGTYLFGGDVKFMVAGSGHIAGVINPPHLKKYQYWTNTQPTNTIEEWWHGAKEHPGSWWPHWHKWLSSKSGKMVKAREPGAGGLGVIEDAPGSYVKVMER